VFWVAAASAGSGENENPTGVKCVLGKNIFNMYQRILILVLYFFLCTVTGIQKILGDLPPDWFMKKFEHTLIDLFPGSMTLCFIIILALELLAGLSFLMSLMKMEFKEDSLIKFANLGFNICLLLFTILFFGSFIAKDYENGFMDLGYFVITIFLQKNYTTLS
jgi:hypothetical protein